MDQKILESVGLTPGESKVYLALLELGESTTGPIITNSGVSASKVYRILESLSKKGLVSHITKESIKYFNASDPHRLIDFLDEEETKVRGNKERITQFLPELLMKKSASGKAPVAEIYEGKKGFVTAHKKLLSGVGPGELYYAINTKEASEIMHNYWKEFHIERTKKNIPMRILYEAESWSINQKGKEREKRELYFPKLLPRGMIVPGNIDLSEGSCLISIMGFDGVITILLQDKKIVKSFIRYFESLWALSKTPKGFEEFPEGIDKKQKID